MRAWPLIAALLFGTSASARTYVVAVHNNQGRAGEGQLQFAQDDARRFVDVLRRLGKVQATDVVVVGNEDADSVRRAVEAVSARIASESPRESAALIFYYSGHADAAGLHMGGSTFPYDALKDVVNAAPAGVRVLVLDGCRSGGLTRVKGARAAEPFTLRYEPRSVEGLAVITSSAAGEDSHESDRIMGSFFTYHLVAALAGAGDRNGDGHVTLTEAYAYAYRYTLQASGRTASLQHPTYSYDLKGRGDLVLTRPGEARAAQLRLDTPATYLVRRQNAKGELVAEVSTERAGVRVALPGARYFVQERHRDHYEEYSVELRSGATTTLKGAPHRRVDYARLVRKGGASSPTRGVVLLGGTRTPVLEGRGLAPEAVLGFAVDFPWATLTLRGRFGQGTVAQDGADNQLQTMGLGIGVERVSDWTAVSLGLGVLVEGTYERQTRLDEVREGAGLVFGVLLSLEVPLGAGLGLRLEGGPMTHVLTVAQTHNGAESGTSRAARLGGAGALGVSWRF